jgi:hypothetical protein
VTGPTLRERAWAGLDDRASLYRYGAHSPDQMQRQAEAIALRNEVCTALERLEMLERAVVDSHLHRVPAPAASPEEVKAAEWARLERRAEALADRMYADDVAKRGLNCADTLRFYLNTARVELGLTPKE